MASFTLYSVNEKKVIEEKIKNNTKYTKELADIETCENLYQGIREVSPIDITILMKKVKKTVRISSKEIALLDTVLKIFIKSSEREALTLALIEALGIIIFVNSSGKITSICAFCK